MDGFWDRPDRSDLGGDNAKTLDWPLEAMGLMLQAVPPWTPFVEAKITNKKSRDYGRTGTVLEPGDPKCPYSICKIQFEEHGAGEYKVFSVREVEFLSKGKAVATQGTFDFMEETGNESS